MQLVRFVTSSDKHRHWGGTARLDTARRSDFHIKSGLLASNSRDDINRLWLRLSEGMLPRKDRCT